MHDCVASIHGGKLASSHRLWNNGFFISILSSLPILFSKEEA